MDWSFNVFGLPFKEKPSCFSSFQKFMEDPASTLRVVCWQANVPGSVMKKDGEHIRTVCAFCVPFSSSMVSQRSV